MAEDPDRVAVVAEDGSLTYGELEARANRLARHLVGLGVEAETLVGVGLPRTTDMVVAVMGVLKAGGAYLPLDPDLPVERLGYMLEDGGAAVLVTTFAGSSRFRRLGVGWSVMGNRRPMGLSSMDHGQRWLSDPDHLAYVSTPRGPPVGRKGWRSATGTWSVSCRASREWPGLSADDVFWPWRPFRLTPPWWSSSVPWRWELGWCWPPGRPYGTVPGSGRLLKRIGVTFRRLYSATIWRMLLDAGLAGEQECGCGRVVKSCPPDLAKKLMVRCGEVWNLYGPTEATVPPRPGGCLRASMTCASAHPWAIIGSMSWTARMQPVPVGVPGELYIGGVGVARGYRNRPELTAERFVPDRFSGEPGARLYRTGDRVRFRDDGTLEFMGRLDDQVKIRGLRIELGEIEVVLVEHEAVRQVAVLVHGEGVGARLVAYVVFEDGALRPPRMRGFLRQFLPDYMVPSLLIELG